MNKWIATKIKTLENSKSEKNPRNTHVKISKHYFLKTTLMYQFKIKTMPKLHKKPPQQQHDSLTFSNWQTNVISEKKEWSAPFLY